MSNQSLQVIHPDGREYLLKEEGIILEEFLPHFPEVEHTTETVPGMHGQLHGGTEYRSRNIDVSGSFVAADRDDYEEQRKKLYRIFYGIQPFDVIYQRDDTIKWTVRLSASFSPSKQTNRSGEWSLQLIADNPYGELIETSEEEYPIQTPVLVTSGGAVELGGVGLDTESASFDPTPARFSVWNHGNETIDPRNRNMHFVMELFAEYGHGEKFRIKNTTTNETFEYGYTDQGGTLNNGDRFTYDGVYLRRNSAAASRYSNFETITLKPGENIFEVTMDGAGALQFEFTELYI